MFDQIPTGVVAFFAWLGSSVGVGAIMSEFFESEPWFQALSAKTKNRLFFLVSLGLGLVSMLVAGLPAETLEKLAPVIGVVITSIIMYLTGQRYHDEAHKPKPEVKLDLEATIPADQGGGGSRTSYGDHTASNEVNFYGTGRQPHKPEGQG